MSKKIITILVIIFVLVFSSILIFKDKKIAYLNANNWKSVLKKNEYSVIYLGKQTDESDDYLRGFTNLGGIKVYYSKLDYEYFNNALNIKLGNNDKYLLFSFDSYIASMEDGLTLNKYDQLLKKYLFNIIPEDEIKYKVPESANDLIKLINGNNYTITVFGKDDCYYCKLYLPTINQIATDYNLDIYYLDATTYDDKEYQKVMDLDLTIPASCTTKKIETSFKKGFAKPTTIITKKGQIVGCIKGNVTKEIVINKLKELKLVEE